MRGYIIANVLLVGQYITLFENLRKQTQEMLSAPKDWQREVKILSSFMTAFNECNHTITDKFFEDQDVFVSQGIVTQAQIDELATLYSNDMTTDQKKKFQEARKKVEDNIDVHRENVTYMDQSCININKLLTIVWEFWKNNRQGNSVNESILKNKRAYNSLTISNIKDIDPYIKKLEEFDGNFNSNDFLTTISRLFTYISELSILVENEKLAGITFYHFVEDGCLANLIKIVNVLKDFKILELSFKKDNGQKIKYIAVDCISSINKKLHNVLTHFVNCSPYLTSATLPKMEEVIKEEGVYESTQHFFVNYVHQLMTHFYGDLQDE
jgi:hypothetical protein